MSENQVRKERIEILEGLLVEAGVKGLVTPSTADTLVRSVWAGTSDVEFWVTMTRQLIAGEVLSGIEE